MGYFMGGLKLEIRQRVHMHRLTMRWQVMQLAHDIEAETEGADHGGDGHNMGQIGTTTLPVNLEVHLH